MRSREEKAPLEESIRVYGIHNAVMFLVASKIADQIQCKALARDPKTGRLLPPAHQILRFAVKARKEFGEDGRHRDTAFAAGLVYDIVALTIAADQPAAEAKRLTDFLEARFTRGLRAGAIALRLARAKKSLKLERYLVSAPLLREAAKGAMACLFPQYPDFLKAAEKSGIALSLRGVAEHERFGGSYQILSLVLSWCFELLTGSGATLLQCDTPFMLSAEKRMDEYDLAAICFLAAHISRDKPAPAKAGTRVRAAEVRPELRELDLEYDPAAVTQGKEGGAK
jgi:hypothetical protein